MLPRLLATYSIKTLNNPLLTQIGKLVAREKQTLQSHFLRLQKFSAHTLKTKLKMGKVYLRVQDDKPDSLHISFKYSNPDLRIDREFNFCRNINENIDDALVRIRSNFEKELSKRAKKGKRKTSAEVPESIIPSTVEILIEFLCSGATSKLANITFTELLNAEYFKDLQLRVIDQVYEVAFNEPWVINVALPTSMLAGFTVYPCKVEIQFGIKEYSQGKWYKAKMPSSGNFQQCNTWVKCGEGFFYDCTNDDVDYYLKFVLTPGNELQQKGPPVEVVSKNSIQAGPGHCPFETRHCFTQHKLSDNAIRVVTYNLLADLYADSDYSRKELFPYCPPYALKIEYRKQVFLKEILGYNADIICLQEVDMKIFDFDLKPVLEAPQWNFRGNIAQKRTCGEGIATFYRSDRFKFLQTHTINIGEKIRTLPKFDKLWKQISSNEKLVERICDRSTTLQLVLLECKETGHFLLIANTHLYFHPDADHIRLLQFGFAMLYVEHIYQEAIKDYHIIDERNLSIIFCGDFNSVPECGIYKLMTEKFVGTDCIDWKSNEEQAVKNVSLTQPFNIKSACGTPELTNYTPLFAACLDYIFYQTDNLEVEQVVPLPTEEELKAHIAIPSVVFPSDHVALVADLKFRKIE